MAVFNTKEQNLLEVRDVKIILIWYLVAIEIIDTRLHYEDISTIANHPTKYRPIKSENIKSPCYKKETRMK
jgi:hypothetical protein